MDLRKFHQEKRMLTNEMNDSFFVQLKEILELMQADIGSMGIGPDDGHSCEQTELSLMDDISMIHPVEDVNLVET